MSVGQVSVFVESKPGHLVRNLTLLQQAGLNVRGYMCSDTGEYGIARFIVDEPDRALAVLTEAGRAVTTSRIACVELADEPGELARAFDVLAQAGINVLYSYSLISTYIAIKTEDVGLAEAALTQAGFTPLSQTDLV